MLRLSFIAAMCGLGLTAPALAQITDTFSDGDFTANPPWTGTTNRFTVAPLDGNPALRSDGAAASDTLYLATPSAASRGTWSFTFAHRMVNLSNFNGARLYLMADTDILDGEVFGYYLQLGASNSDEVRLYRQDGNPATARVLLGQSAAPLLGGDANTLAVTVARSAEAVWAVSVDGTAVFTATDSTYTTSRFFGLWLKHTSASAQSYYFDDVVVQGTAGPVDTDPPRLIAAEALDAEHIAVTFDEVVDACFVDRYQISGGIGRPAAIDACEPGGQATYTLRLTQPMTHGAQYTLTVQNIADRAGNVLAEAAAAFTFIDKDAPLPKPGEVVINEIFYDPPDAALEFVELFNRSDHTFDLRRLRLSDDRLQPVPVSTEPRALQPGGYAVLVRDAAAFRAAFPGVVALAVPGWPALNNSGDTVVLFADSLTLDAVPYRSDWGGDGVSLERKDPAGPSSSPFNFGSSVAPSGATPGAQNSLFAPDRTPPTLRFAEQTADDALDVYLDEPVAPESVQAQGFVLDDGRTPASIFIDPEATLLRLRFDEPLTGGRLRVRGLRDLTDNRLDEATTTLAYLPRRGDLVVNEIMYDPLADRFDNRPDQPEYVELLNRSGRTLTLHRQYWTDTPDEQGTADTLRFGTDFFSVAPEQFALVFAEPNPSDDPATGSTLARAFPAIDFRAEAVVLIPVPRATLGLANAGALIYLHRPDDGGVDSVRYDPSWHHPGLLDATGVALERLVPEGPADDPTRWTSSVAPGGGTPGQANSTRLPPGEPADENGLVIEPSPFSPDRDGHDDVAAIRYRLDQAIAVVRARIFDARGRLVRRLETARLVGSSGELLWDGLDDVGRMLRIGIYVVLVEALDPAGGTVAVFKQPVVLARPLR